ncbi:MAG: hypothetical protein K0R08_331 [Solimicrobium sp.]|jgi:hypothetical protein|nr:hypothetical protein [Solimicrobium sp.]
MEALNVRRSVVHRKSAVKDASSIAKDRTFASIWVQAATELELEAHQRMLTELDKIVRGNCV